MIADRVPVARPADGPATPAGYHSPEGKRRYQLRVVLLTVGVLVAQFIVPMVLMIAMMPVLMLGMISIEFAEVRGAVYFDGQVWYTTRSESPFAGRGDEEGPGLFALDPFAEDAEPRRVAPVAMGSPELLAGPERLWLAGEARVCYLENEELVQLTANGALGDFSPPFTWRGKPAVVQSTLSGVALQVFDARQRRWVEQANSAAPAWVNQSRGAGSLRVLSIGNELHCFLPHQGAVYYRRGSPLENVQDLTSWSPACNPEFDRWTVLALDGKPAVVYHDRNSITGKVLQDGEWKQFFSKSAMMVTEIGACATGQGDEFVLVTQGFPGSLHVTVVEGGKIRSERRYGRSSPFPRHFMLFTTLPHLLGMILPLLMVLILAPQMRRFRVGYLKAGEKVVRYASVARRGWAATVDGLIASLPMMVGGIWFLSLFGDFEAMLSPYWMLGGVLFWVLAFFWALGFFFLFSAMEGRSGQSPGKRLLGIRVVGTDLQPCGFGRALIRNLLRIADGFFQFLVGIVLVALTEKWQRLGDMAAKTVVIRVGDFTEPEPPPPSPGCPRMRREG